MKAYKTYEIKYYPEIGLTVMGKKSGNFYKLLLNNDEAATAVLGGVYKFRTTIEDL